ncbi:DUF7504 family protein [Haloarcula salinisoli]|uniref:RecA-superfamily ATPase, KaiC/GvpD/RAD55 family n=1 Tax=Haloarcula salinisoli TaxID=2487746 RepID=A0A8J7YFA6_9EURY|nr:hypothetical protein [Halomicroarcula salinisoli]MBX0287599.1 hypothetical protein [Halomicroarcula salinisoli]MBX0304835.1 hypothetical protein [Halomicroarcula salinisoli]
MSLATDGFAVDSLSLGPIDSGTSILLTGEDADTLQAVFSQLVAAADDERSIVLSTGSGGRAVQRDLNSARTGAGNRASVLTCEGPASGDDIQSVDDISDLTRLGMDFSTLVASAQQGSGRFRSGIMLCSTIASEIEDTRSLYRFLNSNFLTELRRGDGIGVCALDTSADIGADMSSTISGLQTSFAAHIEVEKTGPGQATLTVDGLDGEDTVDVDL